MQNYREKVAEAGSAPKVRKKGEGANSKMDHQVEVVEFFFKKSDQHTRKIYPRMGNK